MWKFNIHGRKYRDEGDDGGGSGNANGNDGGDNNNNDNLHSHDSLWDANNDGGNNGGDGNDNNDGNQGGDANAAFDQYVATLDFGAGIDMQDAMQAISNGDAEAFSKVISQIGINAYKFAMVDANKVVQQQVDKMGKQVKDDVSASTATSQVVNAMHAQLPFTQQRAFAPVAKLVLTRFLEGGKSPEDAIGEVGKYFKNLSSEVGKMGSKPPSSRPAGGFGGGSNQNAGDDDSGEPDWLDFLGGAPQS